MKVVAVSGWKYSGKDTVAKYLKETKHFYHASFAGPLKQSVLNKYKLEPDQIVNLDLKEAPLLQFPVSPKDKFSLGIAQLLLGEFKTADGNKVARFNIDPSGCFLGVGVMGLEQLYWTPRALMILEGSKERSVNSDHWVEVLLDELSDFDGDPPWLDLEEGATPAEGVVISDLRYQTEASLLREKFGKDLILVRINRFDECDSQDSSERDLDNYDFDVVINNKGTLEDLNTAIEECVCQQLETK